MAENENRDERYYSDAGPFPHRIGDTYRNGLHRSCQKDVGKRDRGIHVLSHPDPAEAPDRLADPDPASIVTRQLATGASHNLLHLKRPVDEKTGRAKAAITVDEVRRAGKFFGQTSGTGNWRIVIIDPADDLNRNAANAILKILEEPPRRSLFLVLTHAASGGPVRQAGVMHLFPRQLSQRALN